MIKINLANEKWKVISDFPNYAVSNEGRIMRLDKAQGTYSGKILKPGKNNTGYLNVSLSMNGKITTKKVSKLISLAFLGPCPPGKEINHKTGIKAHNRIDNLEYVTSSENTQHAFKLGLRNNARGEFHYKAKLTKNEVLEIVRLRKTGRPRKHIANEFNVCPRTISDICLGKSWNWLTKINP